MYYCFFNRGRQFVTTCRTLHLAEDVTIGALIGMLAQEYCVAVVVMHVCTVHTAEGVLGYALTEVPMMHSQTDTEDANCTVLKNQVLDQVVFLSYCC